MGFTLRELGELLQLHAAVANRGATPGRRGPKELASIVQMGQQKLAIMEEKSRLLRKMQRELRSMIFQLQSADLPTCPAGGHANPPRRSTR